MKTTISASQFGVTAGSRTDCTPGVRSALEQAIASKSKRLALEPGEYHFWPDFAFEKYLFVSNNDEGLHRIAFPVIDASDLTIDGQGARLIFHGQITPFVLRGCRNVTLCHVEIDWEHAFHGEARIVDAGNGYVDLAISNDFPYRVDHERLNFLDEDGQSFRA